MSEYKATLIIKDNWESVEAPVFETVEAYLAYSIVHKLKFSDRFTVRRIDVFESENLSADLAQKPTDPEEPPVSC